MKKALIIIATVVVILVAVVAVAIGSGTIKVSSNPSGESGISVYAIDDEK